MSDQQLAPSKAVNAACSSQPEYISNPKLLLQINLLKLMNLDLPQQPHYIIIIIIIIINFSQRHGLHKRLGLQTCSPEYKHTYIYNVAILQHTYTNTR